MTCDDYRGQMFGGETNPELERHLETCEGCATLLPVLAAGRGPLADEAVWVEPTPGLETRILDMIATESGSELEPLADAPISLPPTLQAVADSAPETTSIDVDASRPAGAAPVAVASKRNRWGFLGIAAVLVAALLAFNVSRNPADWTVDVAGGELSPQATAVVEGWNTTQGTRLLLNADGLEPAPEGFFYEMWMSQGDMHISGGTFTGVDDVILWTGVTRTDFPRIWVTLEPIDNDESPSGAIVLDTGMQT